MSESDKLLIAKLRLNLSELEELIARLQYLTNDRTSYDLKARAAIE